MMSQTQHFVDESTVYRGINRKKKGKVVERWRIESGLFKIEAGGESCVDLKRF